MWYERRSEEPEIVVRLDACPSRPFSLMGKTADL